MAGPDATFTIRTRDGRVYPGLTLSTLRTAVDQRIFALTDEVFEEGREAPPVLLGTLLAPPGAPVTGIVLDEPARVVPAPQPRPLPVQAPPVAQPDFAWAPELGPERHRLRLAGAFLLVMGLLGMVRYAVTKHDVAATITMLVNTGFGIALLLNRPEVRKWALGWVLAGWGLICVAGIAAGGCFGFVLVGVFSGLLYGGPACLLWGEECPPTQFWTGVVLMGVMGVLLALAVVIMALAGAALLQRMQF